MPGWNTVLCCGTGGTYTAGYRYNWFLWAVFCISESKPPVKSKIKWNNYLET